MSKKVNVYLADPEAERIRRTIENRQFSRLVSLLILSSRLNPDEESRDLAMRELDVLIDRITSPGASVPNGEKRI